jgi:hypothetical protein
VHNKDLLVREEVPQNFGQSKYSSFARQLNGWGFKQLYQLGNDYDAYYHERFLVAFIAGGTDDSGAVQSGKESAFLTPALLSIGCSDSALALVASVNAAAASILAI